MTNPGTVPDSAYLSIPDSTVVFESPYDSFMSAVSDDSFAAIRGGNHSALATMVYSVPDTVHLPTLISQVGNISDQIFLGNTSSYTVYNSYMNKSFHCCCLLLLRSGWLAGWLSRAMG